MNDNGHGQGRRFVAFLFLACAVLLHVRCTSPTPEELASLAAKGYYEHLAAGEYADFLAGKQALDTMPDGYQQQLQAACRQYVSDLERAHQGVRAVRVSNAVTDTLLHVTNVMLVLSFGDTTEEEIVVPMVEHDGIWKMR